MKQSCTILFALLALALPPPIPADARGAAPAIVSPQITTNGVIFSYYDPDDFSVSVAGDFNDWSINANLLARDDRGVWSVAVPLKPGKYSYQFNLNGVRVTEGEWLRLLEDDCGFAVGVSYEDKFGPLGVVAVMAGRQQGGLVEVASWVLSCRAFSRKIEHHMLDYLFRTRGAKTVRLSFEPTGRNAPLQEFLRSLGLGRDNLAGMELTEDRFLDLPRGLPHEVRTLSND